MRKALRRGLVVLGALLLADQVVQHTALGDGRIGQHWVIPFDPPLFIEWQKQRAADVAALAAGDEALRARSLFDPELGWCPRPGQEWQLYRHDWAGSRIQIGELARAKAPGVRRVVTVGCSFTQGAEVQGPESWSALLDAERPDLEVANLGVAGYGVDQALLRYRRDGRVLAPDEVWLGFLPEATLRITAQFPPAYGHWSPVLDFKPCFRLGPGDALELVPSPAPDYATFAHLLTDQVAFVRAVGESDHWVRRSPLAFAPRGSSWTHWFASTRLFVTWLEGGARDPRPYLADEAGEVYRLLRALVLELADEARADGARFRLLVLPSRSDLAAAHAPAPFWDGLVRDLAGRGIECIDCTSALLAGGAEHDGAYWMPEGHYSPTGNRLVADELGRALAP